MYDVTCFAGHLGSDTNAGHYRVFLLRRGSGRLHNHKAGRKPLALRNFHEVAGDVCMTMLNRLE